ncbi:putative Isochorismatase-like domain-containing protein [Seiridium unicorne]|uniref:Isochorismatase-like domain-containing protein n=1 Tax=Seiridium unicorne TaxID=138068 RepID=A0ABR2UZ03_9PEZI
MTSAAAPNHPSYYRPSDTALLLLDYHNVIVGSIPDDSDRDALIKSTQTLLSAARESKTPILHCLIGTSREPLPTSKLVERWAEQYKPAFESKPELALQRAEVAGNKSSDTEYFFDRLPARVSALKSEGIMDLLKGKLGIKSLILCGVVSSGCVLSTARNAADEDFVVTVVSDACWDREVELHNMVMEKIIPMTGYTVGVEEAVGILKGSGASK